MTPRLSPAARRWGRKVLRYSLVSLISIAVSQSVLVVAFGMLHWTARVANVAACAVATVPSYYLNRSWAWGRRGRSHLWKEVVPFWALAFAGLGLSTWAADLGATLAGQAAASHAATTAIVMTASLLTFGVLWVGKFAILNALLFTERPQPRHLRAPTQPHRELATAHRRPVRVLVVAAMTIGLLLAGSASIRAAQAQPEDPPGSTGPPTTEPATTAPPTTAAPTTAPPTTAPATTQPPATDPPTTAAPTTAPATVPSTTVVGGGGAARPALREPVEPRRPSAPAEASPSGRPQPRAGAGCPAPPAAVWRGRARPAPPRWSSRPVPRGR